MENNVHWLWYWGIDQNDLTIHSPKRKFKSFNRMKTYSSKHSFTHKWIGAGYWSTYDRVSN